MLSKLIAAMIVSGLSTSAMAESPRTIEQKRAHQTSANVFDVKLLDTRVNYDRQNPVVELDLLISSSGGACEQVSHLEYLSGQASLSDALNPTDHYYRLATTVTTPGFCVASLVRLDDVKTTLTFHPHTSFGVIHHVSFDAGMMRGYNRWSMYRVDLRDLTNVTFDYVKTFSLVEGQIQE